MGLVVPPSYIPSLTVGGRVFTDLANLIILYGLVQGTTNVNGTFRRQTGTATAGYTPSGAKSFRALAIKTQVQHTTATASYGHVIGYSDNDVGVAAAAALTNFKQLGGGASGFGAINSNNLNVFEYPIDFVVPNAKYLSQVASHANVVYCVSWVYGYEE
jgi:hypothetical protein